MKKTYLITKHIRACFFCAATSAFFLQAENIFSQPNVMSSADLIQKGEEAYLKGDYKKAAVYLFGFIQKNPAASAKVSPAYEFSFERIVNNVGAKGDNPMETENKPAFKKPSAAEVSAENASVTPPPASGNYSKIVNGRAWTCNDGGTYFITQNNNEVWWYGKGANGGFTNVMHGTVEGNKITGRWSDVPEGKTRSSGTIVLQIDDLYNFHVTEVTGGFGGSKWNTGKIPVQGIKDRVINSGAVN